MPQRFLVLGDSVAHGERTTDDPWPTRVASTIDPEASVAYRGGMATTLDELATESATLVDADAPTTVFVQAGHNDAQLSGGEPRVEPDRFQEAAASLDRRLAESAVETHAFVGLVPLLSIDEPDGVPFADAQPARSQRYDALLAEAVTDHVSIADQVDWHSRTVDGVHPDASGHAVIAEQVLSHLH